MLAQWCTQKQLAQFLPWHYVIPFLLFFCSWRSDVTVALWMWHIHTCTQCPGHVMAGKTNLDLGCCSSRCHHVLYTQIQSAGYTLPCDGSLSRRGIDWKNDILFFVCFLFFFFVFLLNYKLICVTFPFLICLSMVKETLGVTNTLMR